VLQTAGETPPGGDPRGASFACPRHVRTDPPKPPHHTEPQPTTASHRDRPQVPHHTTHNTQNHNTQNHDKQPRQPLLLVPGHRTRHNCPHGPRHAVSPNAAVFSMFLGAARSHQCPLHQPGPLHAGQVTTTPHTHAPARPTPCNCQWCPTPILVPCSPDATAGPQRKATTQHCPAAPTSGLGSRTTGQGRTPALILPTTCAAHTPPANCWRCWRAGRTWEFGRRGYLYRSCRPRRLAPPAPARGRGIYTIFN
jgi:hypothetical protein